MASGLGKVLLGGAAPLVLCGVALFGVALAQDDVDLPRAPQPYTGAATPQSASSFISDGSCGRAASVGSALLGPLGAIGSTWARVPAVGSALRDAHIAPCSTPLDLVATARPAGAGCDLGAIEQ